MAKKLAEFDAWLENEVTTFNELPTKSTVENFRNKISESLVIRLKGQEFDPAPLFDKLNAKCEQRVNQIENKENK